MRCKTAQFLLSASIDGELTEKESIALSRHLDACPRCAAEKKEMLALSNAFSFIPDSEPSAWLAESFAYKLRELGTEKPKRRTALTRLGTVGVAAIALLFVFFANKPAETPGYKTVAPPAVVAKAPEKVETTTQIAAVPKVVVKKPAHKTKTYHKTVKRVYFARLPKAVPKTVSSTMQPEAESVVREHILAAQTVRDDAAVLVADNINDAEAAMDQTLESVRGALQKTVDMISLDTPVYADDSTDGGNTL